MDIEKIKAILLVTVCFFMACLNLWNLFKDWFDKRYQRKNENNTTRFQTKEPIPDIVGKSKFRMKGKDVSEQEDLLKQEINELKKELALQQSQQVEENKPFMSIDMREKPPEDELIDIEEEDIPLPIKRSGKNDFYRFSSGTPLDEFELVVRTLKGKPITEEEEKQVGCIIPKIESTDIYKQFTKQIQGAEERAAEILNRIEDSKRSSTENRADILDFRKYIRDH